MGDAGGNPRRHGVDELPFRRIGVAPGMRGRSPWNARRMAGPDAPGHPRMARSHGLMGRVGTAGDEPCRRRARPKPPGRTTRRTARPWTPAPACTGPTAGRFTPSCSAGPRSAPPPSIPSIRACRVSKAFANGRRSSSTARNYGSTSGPTKSISACNPSIPRRGPARGPATTRPTYRPHLPRTETCTSRPNSCKSPSTR